MINDLSPRYILTKALDRHILITWMLISMCRFLKAIFNIVNSYTSAILN